MVVADLNDLREVTYLRPNAPQWDARTYRSETVLWASVLVFVLFRAGFRRQCIAGLTRTPHHFDHDNSKSSQGASAFVRVLDRVVQFGSKRLAARNVS